MKDIIMTKMDETMKSFFTSVENEFNLPKDALWKKWNGEKTMVVVKKETTPNKKSDYQTFFSIQRNKMVEENPNITFGEISKQVSTMWKKLNPDEKLKYSNPAAQQPTHDTLRKEYMKLSTTDLKNICKEKGVMVKSRKKDDFINALIGWEEKKPHVFKQDELTKGRSKLELSAEDREEEEEDFYFHDDGSSSCDGSRTCEDDDAGILISDDDDDIFGDDDL